MILMLLFLGDRICSWIHNYLLASPCFSSRNCICMCHARAYEPDASFHTFSSLYKPSYFFSLSLSLVSFSLYSLTPFTLRIRSPSERSKKRIEGLLGSTFVWLRNEIIQSLKFAYLYLQNHFHPPFNPSMLMAS